VIVLFVFDVTFNNLSVISVVPVIERRRRGNTHQRNDFGMARPGLERTTSGL